MPTRRDVERLTMAQPSAARLATTGLLCYLTSLELLSLQSEGIPLRALERSAAVRKWCRSHPTGLDWLDAIRLAQRAGSLAERLILNGEAPEDMRKLFDGVSLRSEALEVRLLHFRCVIEQFRLN